MRTLGLILALASTAWAAAVVVDGIAIAVNRHPIKLSDIDRDLRLTEFLNKAALSFAPPDERMAEDRLIDQQIIRGEIASGAYSRATDEDANRLLAQIRTDRYAGSDARLRQDLVRYGVTEDELRSQLLWQLTVLRFINERFREGVMIPDDDIQKYYDSHRTQFHQPLTAVSASIRTSLEGEQVNQQFDSWLDDARKSADIEYKKEAIR